MHTGLWSITTGDYLSEEELEDFQDLVIRDIKTSRYNKNREEYENGETYNSIIEELSEDENKQLRDNKHIWLYCLRIVRSELELQMSQYKADKLEKHFIISDSDNYNEVKEAKEWLLFKARWRTQAMKMLSVVEQKVIYIKTTQEQVTKKK